MSGGKETGDAASIGNEPVAIGVQFLVELVVEHGAGGR